MNKVQAVQGSDTTMFNAYSPPVTKKYGKKLYKQTVNSVPTSGRLFTEMDPPNVSI